MTAVAPPRWLALDQLALELANAGIHVGPLSAHGPAVVPGAPALFDRVMTHDASGAEIDLPPAAAAVIAAHTPQPTEAQMSSGDLAANVQQALTRLDQIASVANPTNAQVVAAVQDEARILRRLLRYIAANYTPR